MAKYSSRKKSGKSKVGNYGIPKSWFELAFVFVWILSTIGYNMLRKHLLNAYGVVVKAWIIDDKNYSGKNPRRFSYSYQFLFDGRQYIGDSLNSSYEIGETVNIRYVPAFPGFNEIVKTDATEFGR